VLEALPAFRGFPELSVGNALGTLVFLLTGSLGAIVLVRPIDVPPSVTAYHLPALGVTVAMALGLLVRGRLGRLEGALLVIAYAAYAAGALLR
jgi:cation:H+ antiporter